MIRELTESQVVEMVAKIARMQPDKALAMLDSKEATYRYLTSCLRHEETGEEPERFHPDDPTPGERVTSNLEMEDAILEMKRMLTGDQALNLRQALQMIDPDAGAYLP
ncbi:hypothetical protein AYO49_00535 [Verrucomicrobiaceae bacterium SCGC AG-212-N21]|nr:hypothetical protein AYO49_00535 [Verrucomicrobiaceae bacterium SCGC AG-212-N21]